LLKEKEKNITREEVMYYYMVYDEIQDGEHESEEKYLGYSSYKINTETDGDKIALYNWFNAHEVDGDIWSDNRIIRCSLEEISKEKFDRGIEFLGIAQNIGEWIKDEHRN
tara:strand:- start:28 stop:357 length:330 start_codon:yes stop_codon:yes gene_type:complete